MPFGFSFGRTVIVLIKFFKSIKSVAFQKKKIKVDLLILSESLGKFKVVKIKKISTNTASRRY